ncbi:MAG: glycoside hydrolase family 31 protein [Alphaproteobacteria bacterium]|nr:glycoside hydrolase family 31 protein [Alphaproteobacteria bacterium]
MRAICAIFAAGLAALPAHAGSALVKTDSGIRLETPSGTLELEPWSARIIHVRSYRAGHWTTYNPGVISHPEKVGWQVRETAGYYTLSTQVLQVRIDRATGALSFRDKSGKMILDEPQGARATPESGEGAVRQDFVARGSYFGLGQHPNGRMDYAGSTVHLQQQNGDVAVPMLVAQSGYAILWNNASVTDVAVADPSNPQVVEFRSEAGGGIDYDFIYGPRLDDVVAGYRELTGDAPMMARWTWGLFQSKEHYATQQELLDVAARYRAMNAPLDAVVQDWQYWLPGQWGSHKFDPARFPDPAAMVKTLHGENVHVIVSVWPRFDPGLDNLAELDAAHAVFEPVYANVYPKGEGRWYDAYSAAGRDIYWRQIMRNLGVLGFDGWWLDASEAELGGKWGEMRTLTTAAGPGSVVYNAYPLLHTTAVAEGMRRDQPDKRVFILTRSAFSGQQRNGAITWSGDTQGKWDYLQHQVPQALNFTLSGIPYWSADIGGFFGGDPKTSEYAELFTRWYEFGAFNPMFRVHGTNFGKEIWQFPPGFEAILLDYDRLRYRLLPYIYSLSWDVTRNRGTMMRALAMDFQKDPKVGAIGDEYMFGKALLVAPVTQKAAVTRQVYLPGKLPWYDFWTGVKHGPGTLVANAPIATIPVYARAGSVVPLGPVVQYADQKTSDPIEIRIYPGADGAFVLYDDAGDGYGYQSGQHAQISLSWKDKTHQLVFGTRQGTFPGMRRQQAFTVICGAAGKRGSRSLDYAGEAVKLSLPHCH